MFVTVQKSVLAEALAKAARMVAKGDTIPILNCIKFTATDEGIRLVGGNTEHGIEVSIPADDESGVIIEKPGSIVLPALFHDIVRKLDGEIIIQTKDQTKDLSATIKSGEAKFELKGFDPEEYPSHSIEGGKRASFVLAGEELKSLVAKTAHCASKSNARPILQGIYVQTSKAEVKFTATDSHRLALADLSTVGTDDALEAVIHRDSIAELNRVIDDKDEVEITLTDMQFIAEAEGIIFRSRLLEGTYPNVDRILPENYSTKVSLNRTEFLAALERLSILTDKKVVKLSVSSTDISHVVELEASQAERGSAKETMFVGEFEGEPISIAFNCAYAIEAIKAIGDQDVLLGFTGEFAPFTITPMNEVNELQLILPVRAS